MVFVKEILSKYVLFFKFGFRINSKTVAGLSGRCVLKHFLHLEFPQWSFWEFFLYPKVSTNID